MKLLIAVVQCARDRWRIPAHREMLSGHGVDVRFFYGIQDNQWRGRTWEPTEQEIKDTLARNVTTDEIELPVDDAYACLVRKVYAMLTWALANGYTHVFKIDADTWVNVEKLKTAGFEQHDWVGLMGDKGLSGGIGHCTSGGVGIWLSEKAIRLYLDKYPQMPCGKFHYYDDWAISLTLGYAGMKPVNSDLLWNFDLGPADKSKLISWHGWNPDPNHNEERGGALPW
jgi:hypothetical protein